MFVNKDRLSRDVVKGLLKAMEAYRSARASGHENPAMCFSAHVEGFRSKLLHKYPADLIGPEIVRQMTTSAN